MAEKNQMRAAKSDRNSSEEHEIDSFYGYLAHVELKIYCIPIIVFNSNFMFSRINGEC